MKMFLWDGLRKCLFAEIDKDCLHFTQHKYMCEVDHKYKRC